MTDIYRRAVREKVRRTVRKEIDQIATELNLGTKFIEAVERCEKVQLDCLGTMTFSLKEPNGTPP